MAQALLPQGGRGLNLPRHLAEHIYMYGGESVRVRFRMAENDLDHVVDWFGTDVRVKDLGDDQLEVSVTCNRQAFKYWAIQYGTVIEVTEPPDLRREVAEAIAEMHHKYQKNEESK